MSKTGYSGWLPLHAGRGVEQHTEPEAPYA